MNNMNMPVLVFREVRKVMTMSRLLATIFDTETTGLSIPESAPLNDRPHIVEFAAIQIDLETLSIVAEFDTLINPGIPIPAESTKIHGITDDDVKEAPTFEMVLPKIGGTFLMSKFAIAHNIEFDRFMVNTESQRLSLNFLWPGTFICTAREFHHEFGYNPSLDVLYEKYCGGAREGKKHRAIVDVKDLFRVLVHSEFFYYLLSSAENN